MVLITFPAPALLQIVPLTPNEWETAGVRLFYDISFFIIVTTIGLNIVFGIIVDTFSELRDERVGTSTQPAHNPSVDLAYWCDFWLPAFFHSTALNKTRSQFASSAVFPATSLSAELR